MAPGLFFPGTVKIVHQRGENAGGVVGAQQIHVAGRHLGRVVFHNGHHGFLKAPAAVQIPDEVHNGRAEGVIHHAVQLAAGKVGAALAVGAFVGRVLPHLAQKQGVGIQFLDAVAEKLDEFVRQLVRHIQPVAIRPQPQPMGEDAIFVRDDVADESGVHFVHRGQSVKVPPGMVDVRPVVEGVPAVIGGFLGIVRAHGWERALPVEVKAVGAGVGIHAVQNDPDAPGVGRVAEGGKIRLGAEKGVGGLVVAGVVAVAGKALGNGVQVENGNAETGNIVHFLSDAPEIATEKVVVQHLPIGGRLPVHFVVPVFVDGVGLQLPGHIGPSAGVKTVGENLIDGCALRPVRGGEVGGDAAQLPEIPGFHVGVVPLLEQAEAAALCIDDEIVEKQAGAGDGKLPLKNVIRALFHLECQNGVLRP